MPKESKIIIVCNQNPPPMLWTPTTRPRSSSTLVISLRTTNSRGILLIGLAMQLSLMPPCTVLRMVDCAGQTASTSLAMSAATLSAPLRT